MNFEGRHIISMNDLDKNDLISIFSCADAIERNILDNKTPGVLPLQGKILGTLFFQPSTRTRLSFETAMLRLGGHNVGFADPKVTRGGDFYQETLEDMVSVISEFVDVIAIRHYEKYAAQRAANVSKVPVINGGDGYNQHPTQALGDIYTIYKEKKKIDGLRIGLIGDLNIRSLRSVITGLSHFFIEKLYVLLPPGLHIPDDIKLILNNKIANWELCNCVEEMLSEVDVIETIGTNHPNHSMSYNGSCGSIEKTPSTHQITKEKLQNVNPELIILHPLPRTDEITCDVDETPYAMYFKQCKYGQMIRMALIYLVTGNRPLK